MGVRLPIGRPACGAMRTRPYLLRLPDRTRSRRVDPLRDRGCVTHSRTQFPGRIWRRLESNPRKIRFRLASTEIRVTGQSLTSVLLDLVDRRSRHVSSPVRRSALTESGFHNAVTAYHPSVSVRSLIRGVRWWFPPKGDEIHRLVGLDKATLVLHERLSCNCG